MLKYLQEMCHIVKIGSTKESLKLIFKIGELILELRIVLKRLMREIYTDLLLISMSFHLVNKNSGLKLV